MSISDITLGLCAMWKCLYQPLTTRTTLLQSLESKASELSRTINELQNLKEDVLGRIGRLILDPSREKSSYAAMWLDSVDALIESSAGFDEQFNARGSSYNCFRCGFYSNYMLAKTAEDLLKQAGELRRNFTDEQLFSLVPEFLLVLRTLDTKTTSLSQGIKDLTSRKTDMERKVAYLISQHQGMESSNRAKDWFQQVEFTIRSYSTCMETSKETLSNTSSFCCLSEAGACSACKDKFMLGKDVSKLLDQVEGLKIEGRGLILDDHLVVAAAPTMVEEIPIYHQVVGQAKEFTKALKLISDDSSNEEVSMIGVYGMGGSGKSTLVHRINNHFINRSSGFDLVVSLTAGRKMSIPKMQKEMGTRLGFSLSDSEDQAAEQARRILQALESKNFLLLLDDLWMEIDISRLGIPPLISANYRTNKRRKMLIATRDKKVCHDMGIGKKGMIQMGLLSPRESWELFCMHVKDKDILQHRQIEQLARDVVNQCGCLPLALVAVGRTMAAAKEVYQWESARSKLRNSAHRFLAMKENVLLTLRFSFETLQSDAMRETLLFCASFPETIAVNIFNISTTIVFEELFAPDVDLGHPFNFQEARREALFLISSLVDSSLLMWYSAEKQHVHLHDCVRDMLVWLMDAVNEYPKMVTWFSKHPSEQLSAFFGRWECAKRISMDGCNLGVIPEDIEIPYCSKLINFRWSDCNISHLPDRFFYTMTSLRVLQLYNTKIAKLPRSVCSLASLRLLDLTNTPIEELPAELGDLQELVYLNLTGTPKLQHIPCKCISRATN